MNSKEIQIAYDRCIRAIYALHTHLLRDHPDTARANSSCRECLRLWITTDTARRDYEALALGAPPTPPKSPASAMFIPAADTAGLAMLQRQAD